MLFSTLVQSFMRYSYIQINGLIKYLEDIRASSSFVFDFYVFYPLCKAPGRENLTYLYQNRCNAET
jgi:hypothetical protein